MDVVPKPTCDAWGQLPVRAFFRDHGPLGVYGNCLDARCEMLGALAGDVDNRRLLLVGSASIILAYRHAQNRQAASVRIELLAA